MIQSFTGIILYVTPDALNVTFGDFHAVLQPTQYSYVANTRQNMNLANAFNLKLYASHWHVCLISSIGWAATYFTPHAVRPGFNPWGGQVDSAFHPFGVGKLRNSWYKVRKTADEGCVVVWLESVSMGLSVRVAGNTAYAQLPRCMLGPGTFEVAPRKCAW
jgi:hypothetical protein